MLEDIITELTGADRVIIPFQHLLGARHVDVIIAEKGDALSTFIFTDDDMLVPGPVAPSQLRTFVSSGLRDQVVLSAPVSVEALVSWKRAAAAAVHHMVLSSESGERAELSREGAVYGYSMALVGELKTDKSSD